MCVQFKLFVLAIFGIGSIYSQKFLSSIVDSCNEYRDNDLNLGSFNLIRVLDLKNGVKVTGRDELQAAFRLTRDMRLQLRSDEIFPFGVPEEFSFGMLYRYVGFHNVAWNLLEITDKHEETTLAIGMNPVLQIVELYIINDNKKLQNYQFKMPDFSRNNWLKVMVGITNSYVTISINCEPLTNDKGDIKIPLKSRGSFGGNMGYISLAKLATSSYSMPIDLQWAVINCDPKRASKDRCKNTLVKKRLGADQLNLDENTFKSILKSALTRRDMKTAVSRTVVDIFGLEQTKCLGIHCHHQGIKGDMGEIPVGAMAPAGPPGPIGDVGPQGPVGQPGLTGLIGAEGSTGPVGSNGPIGPDGSPGSTGPKGPNGPIGPGGPLGAPGPTGPVAQIGDPGLPGMTGPSPSGPMGQQGPAGGIGLPGQPGSTGPSPQGPAGPPGPEGPPGSTGPKGPTGTGPMGPQGIRGDQGAPGDTGPIGPTGPAGGSGAPGPAGPEGQKGIRGSLVI